MCDRFYGAANDFCTVDSRRTPGELLPPRHCTRADAAATCEACGGRFRLKPVYLPPAATRAAAAAPAFLLRRLGFVGRSGASPTNSMVIRLVTNFFVPTLSKSIVVRSTSDSATIPNPYWSCLMHCPSERICTTASLFAPATSGHFLRGASPSCPEREAGRTHVRSS